MGGSFVARSFSGDREQLVTLIKAGLKHRGCAVLDVVSPCVTFNDHEGSTKSYAYTREHYNPAVNAHFVPPATVISAQYEAGESLMVEMHDGSKILLKKADDSYDPTVRSTAMRYLEERSSIGEVVTGLLFVNEDLPLLHDVAGTAADPLAKKSFSSLNPGSKALAELQQRLR